MKINSISASGMQNALDCLAKYYAENVLYTPRTGNTDAADVGTACHGAMEHYVKAVYVDRIDGADDLGILLGFYDNAYEDTFGYLDKSADTYKDGVQMLKRWHERTDLSDVEILSLEKKETIMFKTPQGPKKLNYIIDRVDTFMDGDQKVIRLTDYKTIRANLSPEQLRAKPQARMYAMCLAIQYKDIEYDRIDIEFDLLRYEPVCVSFDREENLATWDWLKSLVRRIDAADESKLSSLETLNPGCGWCVRKATCSALKKNIDGGGIAGMSDNELAAIKEQAEAQAKANKYLIEEVNDILLHQAQTNNEIEWETDDYEIVFKSRRSSVVDNDEIAEILGPEQMARYGKVGVTDIKKMLKDEESGLSVAQQSRLRSAIKTEFGSPKPTVTRKTGL